MTISILAGDLLAASPSFAAPNGLGEVQSSALLGQLLGLFVIATVMESALTTIFQWRLYKEVFNGRAVKTLVMIGASYAVVKGFDYDVFARIMGLAGGSATPSTTSQILSALILAGGSAAIYQLFASLGFRLPVDAAQVPVKPAENFAWLSVKIVRKRAVGRIRILIEELSDSSPESQTSPPLSGLIGGRSLRERLKGIFFADSMRHPPYGGLTVKANTVYRVQAAGQRTSEDRQGLVEFQEEVFFGRFASRSIIDFMQEI